MQAEFFNRIDPISDDHFSESDCHLAVQEPGTSEAYRLFWSLVAPRVRSISENGVCCPLPDEARTEHGLAEGRCRHHRSASHETK